MENIDQEKKKKNKGRIKLVWMKNIRRLGKEVFLESGGRMEKNKGKQYGRSLEYKLREIAKVCHFL